MRSHWQVFLVCLHAWGKVSGQIWAEMHSCLAGISQCWCIWSFSQYSFAENRDGSLLERMLSWLSVLRHWQYRLLNDRYATPSTLWGELDGAYCWSSPFCDKTFVTLFFTYLFVGSQVCVSGMARSNLRGKFISIEMMNSFNLESSSEPSKRALLILMDISDQWYDTVQLAYFWCILNYFLLNDVFSL